VMNSLTESDADGRVSYKNGTDKKSDFSSNYISTGALRFKTIDESGGGGDGKEGEFFEAAQNGDCNSDGSGVAGCGGAAAKVGGGEAAKVGGGAAAKVAGHRVGVKKLQQGNNYRLDEDLNFLQIMEEILPITDEEWTSVVEQHNESYSDFDWVGERNEDSLRH